MLDEVEEWHQVVDRLGPLRNLRSGGRLGLLLRRRSGGWLLGHGHRSAGSPRGLARCSRTGGRSARRARGLAAGGPANRDPGDEHPADVRHGLAADEASFVEQPGVVAVELLEGVVRQHRGVRLVGDSQHEGVAATDRTGGWGNQLVVGDALLVGLGLLLRDAVSEGGVDDDGDECVGVFGHVARDSFVELFERRHRATLGGDVGSVDDDVSGSGLLRHLVFRVR